MKYLQKYEFLFSWYPYLQFFFLCFKPFLKIQDLGGHENTVSATPHNFTKL